MAISPVSATESGSSVRTKVNAAITKANLVDDKAAQADLTSEAATRAAAISSEAGSRVAADNLRATYAEISMARARPGENGDFFAAAYDGTPESLNPRSGKAVATDGKVAIVTGEGMVAPRGAYRIEPGHPYRVRFVVRRATNTTDPANDAIRLGLRCLSKTFDGISSIVLVNLVEIVEASGRVEQSFVFPSDGYILPPGTVYVRPYVYCYGSGGVNHIEVIEVVDLSDAIDFSPDVGIFQTQVSGLQHTVDIVQAGVNLLQTNQISGLITKETWTALAATSASDDVGAEVMIDTDTGTHTDPVTSDTVPNWGRFIKTSSGWKRTGDGVSAVIVKTELLAATASGATKVKDEDGYVAQMAGSDDGTAVSGGWLRRLLNRGVLSVSDIDGKQLLAYDRRLGLGLPYAWLKSARRSAGNRLLRIADADDAEFVSVDRQKGLGLPHAWLRSIRNTGSRLLRIADADGAHVLSVDRAKGLGLPYAWLKSAVLKHGDIFRLSDIDGKVLLSVDKDGYLNAKTRAPTCTAVRIWSGHVTDTSFEVACDVEGKGTGVGQLVVSTDAALDRIVGRSPAYFPQISRRGGSRNWRSLKMAADGLLPDTQYFYGILLDGKLASDIRKVKTFPKAGTAAGYRMIFGSCSDVRKTTVSSPALAAMADEDALILFHLGDLSYSDIGVDDITLPRAHNSRRYRDCALADDLAAVLPIAYVPDDHDSSINDPHWDTVYASGATFPAIMANTRQVIVETTPIYPLVEPRAMTQVIDIGKTRHILLDTRSQSRYTTGTATALGIGSNPPGSWDQLTWLKAALITAGTDGVSRIFLHSPRAWIGGVNDDWVHRFSAERTAICDYIRDTASIPPVTILTGDAHFCAADDGANTDGSTGGGMTVASLMSSPFHMLTLGTTGTHTWMGSSAKFLGEAYSYCVMDVAADGEWEARFYGNGALLGTFASGDDTPEVDFASAGATVTANSQVNVVVDKTWLGPAGGGSVHWATDNGQSGNLAIRANCGKYTIPVTAPASGSITVTLSSPVGCTLGPQTTTTLTI